MNAARDLPAPVRGLRALVASRAPARRAIWNATLRSWDVEHEFVEGLSPALPRLTAARAADRPFHVLLVDSSGSDTELAEVARGIRSTECLRDLPLAVLVFACPTGDGEPGDSAPTEVWLHHPSNHPDLLEAVTHMVRAGTVSPAVPPGPASPLQADQTPIAVGRVLLAEDKRLNRELARDVLAVLGFQADLAENGRQAVDAFRAGVYDLVLMDCQMPEMDGYEATQALRQIEASQGRRRTPILALTGRASEEDVHRGLAAGMDDYLLKPFRIQQLREVLDRWLPGTGESRSAAGATREAPAPAAAGPESVLDEEALENLRSLERQGATGVVRNTLQFYVEDAPPLLAEIHDAARAGDAPTVRRAAHALKSLSANVGAQALAALCQELEDLGRSGSIDWGEELLVALETVSKQALNSVRSHIEKEQP